METCKPQTDNISLTMQAGGARLTMTYTDGDRDPCVLWLPPSLAEERVEIDLTIRCGGKWFHMVRLAGWYEPRWDGRDYVLEEQTDKPQRFHDNWEARDTWADKPDDNWMDWYTQE